MEPSRLAAVHLIRAGKYSSIIRRRNIITIIIITTKIMRRKANIAAS